MSSTLPTRKIVMAKLFKTPVYGRSLTNQKHKIPESNYYPSSLSEYLGREVWRSNIKVVLAFMFAEEWQGSSEKSQALHLIRYFHRPLLADKRQPYSVGPQT